MMDDASFKLVTSLRLGAPCVARLCCEAVDSLGHHGLSCYRSTGRIARHTGINDIRRALASAGVPAVLEPNSLVRDDGKRPDGMTLLPWKVGRPLVWDATSVDTLVPSHVASTASCAGAAATAAETLKRRRCATVLSRLESKRSGLGARVRVSFIKKYLADSSTLLVTRGLARSLVKELALPFNVAMLPVF